MKVIHINIHTLINIQDLINYRVTNDLTQQGLALKLGLTRELINKMEKGKLEISESTQLKFDKLLKSETSSHVEENKENYQKKDRGNTHFSEKSVINSSKISTKADDTNLSMQTILSLSESNNRLARSQETLADNNSRLITLLENKESKNSNLNVSPETFEDVATRLNILQEFLLEQIALSQNKRVSDLIQAFDTKLSGVVMDRVKKDIPSDVSTFHKP